MNWAAWGPTIVSVVTMIFVAGMTYGRIKGQEVTLKRHDGELKENRDAVENLRDEHGARIDTLELQAERSKGWREGFEMGKSHKDL